MNTAPLLMGGAREQVLDIIKKYAQPLNVYVGLVLVLGITYINKIPGYITFRANTFLGRLFLFLLTIVVADMYSWVYALLMALFTVLIIAVAPRTLQEAFKNKSDDDEDEEDDTEHDIKMVTEKKRWWAEEVFKENPIGIEDDKVKTSAVQDNTNSNSSTTSSK